MEKMKTNHKPNLRTCFILLPIWAMLLSCSLFSGASPSREGTEGLAAPGADATIADSRPDPLDRLLAMRSIKINLVAQHPDGTSSTIDADIDTAGNMILRYSAPSKPSITFPKGVDPNTLPANYTMYVLGGKAYLRDDKNPDWTNAPVDEDYLPKLADQFHGPDCPALWLDMLPLGSIQAAGHESRGGFTTDRYTVKGAVAGQQIIGTIWFEPQADALTGAELHIPAALLESSQSSQNGELKITLSTENAEAAPVTLPR
jgi:hypothetical protein